MDNVSGVYQNRADFMALKVKLCKDLNVTIWHLTDKVDFSYFVNDEKIVTVWAFAKETFVYMSNIYHADDILKLQNLGIFGLLAFLRFRHHKVKSSKPIFTKLYEVCIKWGLKIVYFFREVVLVFIVIILVTEMFCLLFDTIMDLFSFKTAYCSDGESESESESDAESEYEYIKKPWIPIGPGSKTVLVFSFLVILCTR